MSWITASRPHFLVLLPLIVAVLVLSVDDAHAGESSRLAYLRGPGTGHCPDEPALRSAVAVRLGYDPFVAWAKTTVHAQLGRDGSNLRARVYLADENGHIRGSRALSAPVEECQNLIAAVALAISIAIDPMSANSPAPPKDRTDDAEEPPRAAEKEPPAAATVAAPGLGEEDAAGVKDAGVSAPSQRAPAPLPTSWFLGLGTHLTGGTAPDLAVGLAAFARFNLGQASLGLEGRYDFPASADAPSGNGAVSSSLLLASLEPCFHVSSLYLCGLVSVGSLRGAGTGVTVQDEKSTVYWGAGGRVAFELGIAAPLLLRAHLDLIGNATRTTLLLDGSEVWRAPPIAVVAGISAVARVW